MPADASGLAVEAHTEGIRGKGVLRMSCATDVSGPMLQTLGAWGLGLPHRPSANLLISVVGRRPLYQQPAEHRGGTAPRRLHNSRSQGSSSESHMCGVWQQAVSILA